MTEYIIGLALSFVAIITQLLVIGVAITAGEVGQEKGRSDFMWSMVLSCVSLIAAFLAGTLA